MDDINLNKLSKKELTKFARKLASTNTAIWNAVCAAENLVKDPIFRSFHYKDESEEFLKKLARAFNKINKQDEDFVSAELHSSYFQDFDYFTNKLEEYLEEIEE